jgi:hypothetical protein
MLKKCVLLLVMMFIAIVYADADVTKVTSKASVAPKHCGVYLGVDGGVSCLLVKQKLQYIRSDNNEADTFVFRKAAFSGFASGFLGYGYQFNNNIYLALEGYVGGPSSEANVRTYNIAGVFYETVLTREIFYGILPKIGFFIKNDCLLYLTLGVEASDLKAQYMMMDNGNEVPVITNSDTKASFVPGIGLLAFFCRNLFLRIDYKAIISSEVHIGNPYVASTEIGNYTFYQRVKFYNIVENRAALSLGYKF